MRILNFFCVLFAAMSNTATLYGNTGTAASGLSDNQTPAVSVRLVPAKAHVVLGTPFTFTAYISGTKNKAANWMVNGIAGGNSTVGTIANGVYTPPAILPDPDSVSVQAQSQQNTSSISSPSTASLSNPTPTISSVSPNPIPYGTFRLSISGTGFVPGAQVMYGGANLPTTFVSSTALVATGTAVPNVGAIAGIVVINPGATPLSSALVGVPLQESKALVSYASAYHFLEQATFGPTPAAIDHLQQVGFQQWFLEQANAPISPYTPNAPDIPTLQSDFFYYALTGPDQLRQRVTFALSQIFVISAFKNYQPVQFEPYLQILQEDALGGFFKLMNDITTSPTMGHYLDMANNNQAKNNSVPNENYGRELMQLFTIGPVLLNMDGTPQLDNNGNTIPNYTETTIENFARALTGWTYPVAPGATPEPNNPAYFVGPMIAWEANHDTGAKTLLNGVQLPAGQSAEQDLQSLLQNVFNHQNVAPFVSTLLIQHLVSSNPSPAYVQRIAEVFNDDGSGNRGNLYAVVKAILLDQEARQSDSPSTWIPTGGHLREPALFLTSVLRNLNATAVGPNVIMAMCANMGQQIFYPQSVAGYYTPSYPMPGSPNLLGPEYQTLNSSSGLARVNWINGISWGGTSSSGITIDLTPFITLAGDPTGSALIQGISNTFMAGQMPQTMQTVVSGAMESTPNYPPGIAATAIYLTASSGLYQVQH